MKLPAHPLKSAMLCVAFALTGCSHEYHQGYGGAYLKAKKEGKTEFEARRIAEAAGDKADEDEDAYQARQLAQSQEMIRSLQRQQNDLTRYGSTPGVGATGNLPPSLPMATPHVEVK